MDITIYDSVSQVEPITENLWSVTNCFGPETFNRLSQAHTNFEDTWHRHPDCLEYRLQLTPNSPTLQFMNSIGHTIGSRLECIVGQKLSAAEAKLWLDVSGWHCPYHADDPLLVVTYQIFLWSHGEVNGTEFVFGPRVQPQDWSPKAFEHHERVATKFIPNTGYINLNTDAKIHHCHNITGTRLSAAWQFRREV